MKAGQYVSFRQAEIEFYLFTLEIFLSHDEMKYEE